MKNISFHLKQLLNVVCLIGKSINCSKMSQNQTNQSSKDQQVAKTPCNAAQAADGGRTSSNFEAMNNTAVPTSCSRLRATDRYGQNRSSMLIAFCSVSLLSDISSHTYPCTDAQTSRGKIHLKQEVQLRDECRTSYIQLTRMVRMCSVTTFCLNIMSGSGL